MSRAIGAKRGGVVARHIGPKQTTIAVGGQTVAVPVIALSTAVVAPTRVDRTVDVPAIGVATAVVAPIRVDRTVAVPAIAAGTAILAPARIDQTVNLPVISAALSILAPATGVGQFVAVPVIALSSSVVAPLIVTTAALILVPAQLATNSGPVAGEGGGSGIVAGASSTLIERAEATRGTGI